MLDRTGLVLSDAAHVVTRLRRLDAQTMEARMVIEDQGADRAVERDQDLQEGRPGHARVRLRLRGEQPESGRCRDRQDADSRSRRQDVRKVGAELALEEHMKSNR